MPGFCRSFPLFFFIAYHLSFCHAGKVSSRRSNGTSIERLIFFGDSFTDQSRSHSIANGTYPGKGYQEVYPPTDSGINGGISWPRYLSLYTGLPFDNYACGGAACSNALTPLGPPDISSGQLTWFIEDHVVSNATPSNTSATLNIPGATTLAIIWIGTNDLGIHSLLAPDNPTAPPYTPNVPPLSIDNDNATTLPALANCQLNAIRTLHDQYGIQNFLLLSTIPLHLTRLYAPIDSGTIYWPSTHDGASWNRNIFQFSNALNAFLRTRAGSLNSELPSANVEFFDTYRFFEKLYLNPTQYFNGSLPVNVTGHCHQCPNATDYHFCGIGDCTGSERDSYMWWDELHPSEQTGRLLAAEVMRKIEGVSSY